MDLSAWAGPFLYAYMMLFDDYRVETPQFLRYFTFLFGDLTLLSYFCRRICNDITYHKVNLFSKKLFVCGCK